jgi:hypothetical protein
LAARKWIDDAFHLQQLYGQVSFRNPEDERALKLLNALDIVRPRVGRPAESCFLTTAQAVDTVLETLEGLDTVVLSTSATAPGAIVFWGLRSCVVHFREQSQVSRTCSSSTARGTR